MSMSFSFPSGQDVEMAGLQLGSFLTDPICNVRKSYYSLYTVKDTSGGDWIEAAGKVVKLGASLLVNGALALPTAALGAVCRGAVSLVWKGYELIQLQGDAKTLPEDRKLTVLSDNVCFMPAGYSITDGGVPHHADNDNERMKANLTAIKDAAADIVCLYEVPGIDDAMEITRELRSEQYVSFIPIAGVRAIGPGSMMYVASKYRIKEGTVEFSAFTKGEEVKGRAAGSEKGFLSFEIETGTNQPVFVISTHLQHSEIPGRPEPYEVECRALQIARIMRHVEDIKGRRPEAIIILTGDLNQDEKELLNPDEGVMVYPAKPAPLQWLKPFSSLPLAGRLYNYAEQWFAHEERFQHAPTANKDLSATFHRDPQIEGKVTWQGEGWGADLMGKEQSEPCVLDYTFVSWAANIETQIIPAGFDMGSFSVNALSDHDALLSTIELPEPGLLVQ